GIYISGQTEVAVMTAKWISLFGVFLVVGLTGCGTSTVANRESSAEKDYEIKGQVIAIAADRRAVTLDHEDIPGLMKGMKMEFGVEDSKLLEGIKAGDQVQGRLKQGKSGYVIT